MKPNTEPRVRMRRGRPAISLPPGALACRDCGDAVTNPRYVERAVAIGRQVIIPPGVPVVDEREFETSFSLCLRCLMNHVTARQLLTNQPRLRRRLGSFDYAVHIISAAFAALDALGLKQADVDRLTATPRELNLVVKWMAAAGVQARWSARLVPITQADADLDTCAPRRWAHLTDAEAQRLRDDYAALLRNRIEHPEPYPHPEGGGCLLCGVGVIEALPSRAEEVGLWSGPWQAVTRTLGGDGTRGTVHGYLCPECTKPVEMIGSVTTTALENAVFAYLGVRRRAFGEMQIRGLRAWIALPNGTPPNSVPWEHEPDLESLADEIRWPDRLQLENTKIAGQKYVN